MLPSTGALSKCPQWAQFLARNSIQASHIDNRNTITWAVTSKDSHYLEAGIRNQNQDWAQALWCKIQICNFFTEGLLPTPLTFDRCIELLFLIVLLVVWHSYHLFFKTSLSASLSKMGILSPKLSFLHSFLESALLFTSVCQHRQSNI